MGFVTGERVTGSLRHSDRPGLCLTGVWLKVKHPHRAGLPVLRSSSHVRQRRCPGGSGVSNHHGVRPAAGKDYIHGHPHHNVIRRTSVHERLGEWSY
jgi:hypothetical protein